MQLSHAEVGFREFFRALLLSVLSARIARSAMLAISLVAVTYMLVTGGNGVATTRYQLVPISKVMYTYMWNGINKT